MEAAEVSDAVDFSLLRGGAELTNGSRGSLRLFCLESLVHVRRGHDVMAFVAVSTDCPLHWTDNAVTNVFPKLWLRKVISSK